MRQLSFLFLMLFVLGVTTATRSVSAQGRPEPVIRIVEVTSYRPDNKPATLNIYGSGFGTIAANVSASLAGTQLPGIVLSAAGETEIISATIPVGNWLPGTYRLKVNVGVAAPVFTVSADVTIGAQGPRGVAGATGAQGLQGAQGAQGAQGLQGLQGPQGAQGPQGLPGTGGIGGLQEFTQSSTFTVPAGVRRLFVELWGAGGLGGSLGAVSGNVGGGGGGGGGAGGYSRKVIEVTPGEIYNIVIGAPGNSDVPAGGDTRLIGAANAVLLFAAGGAPGNSGAGSAGGVGGNGGQGDPNASIKRTGANGEEGRGGTNIPHPYSCNCHPFLGCSTCYDYEPVPGPGGKGGTPVQGTIPSVGSCGGSGSGLNSGYAPGPGTPGYAVIMW